MGIDNLKASDANMADLVSETKLISQNLKHVSQQLAEFMTSTREMTKLVHHLDKNAATKSEVNDMQSKLHKRIDDTNDTMREGFKKMQDNWWKLLLYMAVSGGVGGGVATFSEMMKIGG